MTIEASADQQHHQRRTYDLDVEADPFYAKYAGALFPEAIQANGAELAEVSKKEEEIRTKTMSQLGGGGGAAPADDPMQDGCVCVVCVCMCVEFMCWNRSSWLTRCYHPPISPPTQ